MSKLPFRYVDFWDVPRVILVGFRDRMLLLQSAFNEELDDYDSNYSIYELSAEARSLAESGSWKFMERQDLKHLGEIPVNKVQFDSTNRKTLDSTALEDLVGRY